MNPAGAISERFSFVFRGRPGVVRLVILFLAGLFTTIIFFPSITFFGYTQKPGDVAVMDVKSPVDVSSGDIRLRKGEIVIRDGQVITEADAARLRAVEAAVGEKSPIVPVAGFFVFTIVFMSVSYLFSSRNIRKFSTLPKDLILLAVIYSGVLVLLRLSGAATAVMKEVLPVLPAGVYVYLIPVAVGPMLVRLLLNSEVALVFAAFVSVMTGYYLGGSLEVAAYSLIGGLAASMGVRHCTHRSIVIKAGLLLGAINSATLVAIGLINGSALTHPAPLVVAGFLNGMVTAVLAIGIAPLLEVAFQYTTNIRLLELSRMDHPLLKELAVRAPGTYHHSIVIGTLVEAAAESINANPLLARVAAYYHDIGKLKMPAYFIENISHENRHDKLAPSMSSLILLNHVKEGVELAGKYRLGSEIIDVINQHHGTSLIMYFYQKAKNSGADGQSVDEIDYRYPGPKPQTKEAGLVMLADAIEAASKTITDPTPDKIQWLTQKIVNKIFTDGQLDECELTLKDLHAITKSFNRVFAGIYHHRIDYPEPAFITREDGVEGIGAGQVKGEKRDEDKKDVRDRLKRLGI
ncbi:MAG: HDIG domain-containing metalloprotein [Deltaproteobacteria bacterium]